MTGTIMTIAERLRIEKRNAVNFDAVVFMGMLEDWFRTHDYDSYITVKSDDCYKQYPGLCTGTIRRHFCTDYPTISHIGVPPEYLNDALKLAKDEGFYIYRENQFEYKVSLLDVPCITSGYSIWHNATKTI